VEPIAVVFGTALVAAMATDTWQQAHEAVAALWRRIRSPRQVPAIDGELEELRELVLAARRDGQADTEQALARVWQDRCQDLLMHGTAQDSSVLNQVAGDQYNIQLPRPLPPPVACTLPADTPAFTGRDTELCGIIAAALAAVKPVTAPAKPMPSTPSAQAFSS
jgi:hypothetical protein